SCVSLLDRDSDRAVVTSDRSQRFLSPTSPRNYGQTADWFSSGADPFDPARSDRMCGSCTAEPAGDAALAILMDGATGILRPLHTIAGFARAFTATCVVALSRSRRDFIVAGGDHAAEMVLRRLHFVADPQVPTRDSGHGVFQLWSWHLALVSHSSQLHRGGTMDCAIH